MSEEPDRPVLLVDLSSLAYPVYAMSAGNPDPDHTWQTIVGLVHDHARGYDRVAVCCDGGGQNFRKAIDPTYKANRPEKDAVYLHHYQTAIDKLKADGFTVWRAEGFEADDLIASAAAQLAPRSVVIVTADKDLLQLVDDPRVVVKSARDGTLLDSASVKAKLGVHPTQVVDYLSLVGDTSDNIKGADKIGPKKAVDLLTSCGSLENVYKTLDAAPQSFTAGVVKSLQEFASRADTVRQLITLRTDAPVPVDEILTPREAPPMDDPTPEPLPEPITPEIVTESDSPSLSGSGPTGAAVRVDPPETASLPSRPVEVSPAPSRALVVRDVEFERQLEPASMNEATTLATYLDKSRLFMTKFGTPHQILAAVLAGRELGLQSMASLRAFHVVEGVPTLAADFIRALVLKSGKAVYFRCLERTGERATFSTRRTDDPDHEITLSFSVDDAKRAGLGGWDEDKQKFKAGSGWHKSPADQCAARASAKLARLAYPELLFGLYAPEEMEH